MRRNVTFALGANHRFTGIWPTATGDRQEYQPKPERTTAWPRAVAVAARRTLEGVFDGDFTVPFAAVIVRITRIVQARGPRI